MNSPGPKVSKQTFSHPTVVCFGLVAWTFGDAFPIWLQNGVPIPKPPIQANEGKTLQRQRKTSLNALQAGGQCAFDTYISHSLARTDQVKPRPSAAMGKTNTRVLGSPPPSNTNCKKAHNPMDIGVGGSLDDVDFSSFTRLLCLTTGCFSLSLHCKTVFTALSFEK